MPMLELSELLDNATAGQAQAIRAALYASGVLWRCRNPSCSAEDLPRQARRCDRCGYDRQGRPRGDSTSLSYGPVPEDLLSALREALVEWFTYRDRPRPDAVTFHYTDENDGAHDWSDYGDLHFGGRTEHDCDFSFSGVAEALVELTDFEAPSARDEITLALPR
ncbi:hypothetical protein OG215_36675 (plasmid) [Streptomyces globisporus]|uniref:hypothetical protein n=1 Tax=Streptomyces globisporus TaxID=1908 RepID=UPI002F91A35F|nr:hypothetical protein OG215_36675 [Streptomyces globisporus]